MFTHHISPVKICSFLCFPIPRSSRVHSVPCSHQHAMSLLWLAQTPTPARTMSKVSSWSRSWLHSQGLWEDLDNVLDIHLSIYMFFFYPSLPGPVLFSYFPSGLFPRFFLFPSLSIPYNLHAGLPGLMPWVALNRHCWVPWFLTASLIQHSDTIR